MALHHGRRPDRLQLRHARGIRRQPDGRQRSGRDSLLNTRVDDKGEPLTGANKYVLHFDKDKLPPVSVFWNLNMYDEKEFFIENDFKRYSIGSTTDGLKTGADGSIDIFVQKDNPGPDKSNWLPAPSGVFNLTMRLYGAQTPILNGSYRLPIVKRVQ